MDVFADVTGFPTYLGTVTASDGTALVDLILDRDPFMLANGPRRAARPHVLIVPRSHRDGWSSATAQELTARHTAMTLVATWYRSLDGGHAVFAANDSAPNLDYLRDAEAANGTRADSGTEGTITRNPRQDVQRAHLHAFYAEHGETENHESSAVRGIPSWQRVTGCSVTPSAPTPCGSKGIARRLPPTFALRRSPGAAVTARTSGAWRDPAGLCPPWASQDEFNRRLARADGLRRSPTRGWAALSTWCGPAWAMPDGAMRRNGPRPISGLISGASRPASA